MATIKSYTDISQSRKLSEILSLESADMSWVSIGLGKPFARTRPIKGDPEEFCACWSLAALLGVLPNENMLVKTTDGEYYCLAKDVMTKHYDNPVDVCADMIIKLHELNLL